MCTMEGVLYREVFRLSHAGFCNVLNSLAATIAQSPVHRQLSLVWNRGVSRYYISMAKTIGASALVSSTVRVR